MSPPSYRTAEQYERWHKRTCARCGRFGHFAAKWPDGHVCRTCHDRALRNRGTCPGCGTDRPLPGLRPDDRTTPVCADCAGFTVSYRCSRCGTEDKLHGRRLCTRCTLTDRITDLLSAGTGRIRPELVPLAERIITMKNPLSGLTSLSPGSHGRARTSVDLLRELGRGEIALTHEAFHALEPWRAAAHLEELLMACGVLPTADKQICSLERWLPRHLNDITDPAHAQLIRRYATWEVLPRMRQKAAHRPLTTGSQYGFRDRISYATRFLRWLAERGRTLSTCGQAEIDLWCLEHSKGDRACLRPFLRWCAANRLTPRFEMAPTVVQPATAMPEHERLDLIGRILTETDNPLQARAAAAILLLYAQPVTRIVRLRIDDIIHHGTQTLLRLGEPPSPVPEPVACLLLDWASQRANMNTATNQDSGWLFPGRRADQPLHPTTLRDQIRALGIPVNPGRVSAIQRYVFDTPAPVVATALGYHHTTTTRAAAQTGAPWAPYAASPRPRIRDS
jgi:integrase